MLQRSTDYKERLSVNPIKFEGHNIVYAEDQPEYLPLPAYRDDDNEGSVISCWQLSWRERFKILWTGQFWFTQWTFHSPLQPQLPSVDRPITIPNRSMKS